MLLVCFGSHLARESAYAQSACAQLGVDCSHKNTTGSEDYSRESDEDRRARLEAAAEARAERKAERERQRAAQKKEQEEKRQRSAEARQKAEDERKRQAEDARQREVDAEQQRRATIEAQQRQAAFDQRKPSMTTTLKGVDEGSQLKPNHFGLKDADSGSAPRWDARITDPEVAKHASKLASVVPPLPMPKEEVSLGWKEIYLGDDRLMKTSDYVIAGWEMAGVIGTKFPFPYKYVLIGGKTFIAGEDAAYLHLVKREQDYDAALAFLKNPAQAPKFARLVQDIREKRLLPATADPGMVKAAQAITDPALGNSGVKIAIDAMLSTDALSAMMRKAAIELVSEAASDKLGKVLGDLTKRKEVFESVRLEREQLRRMMTLPTTTPEQRVQLKTAIDEANKLSANIYKMERVRDGVNGLDISDATDKLANYILGPEAESSKQH